MLKTLTFITSAAFPGAVVAAAGTELVVVVTREVSVAVVELPSLSVVDSDVVVEVSSLTTLDSVVVVESSLSVVDVSTGLAIVTSADEVALVGSSPEELEGSESSHDVRQLQPPNLLVSQLQPAAQGQEPSTPEQVICAVERGQEPPPPPVTGYAMQ